MLSKISIYLKGYREEYSINHDLESRSIMGINTLKYV